MIKPEEYNKTIKLTGKNNGYWIFQDSKHPLNNTGCGFIYFHRHVASIKLGRWLTKEEFIHHIDGNKENNNPNNLAIVTNSEHANFHRPKIDIKTCSVCKKQFQPANSRQVFCSFLCMNKSQRKFDPTKNELEYLLSENTIAYIARLFNVSWKAVKKRCKRLGIVLNKSRLAN
jgi:hypothetical protein